MKKKVFLFGILYLFISFSLFAQSNTQLISNTLGQDSSVTASFVDGMINIDVTSICDPWDDDGPCTDLCDPWDDRPCSKQAKMYSTSSAKEKERLLIKIMSNFEKAMAKGKGGKVLTSKTLAFAKKKHSGNGLHVMRSRFNMYIQHLKNAK